MTIENRLPLKRSHAWHNPQVHQATGVILAQTKSDPEHALSLLLKQAESTGLPVDAVAAAVIAHDITFN